MDQASRARIEATFEIAAERCPDLTPLVYARLFREHPHFKPLFVLDADNAVKGSMLSWAIVAILDFVGPRNWGGHLIRAEAVNHSRNGVEIAEFPIFLRALAATLETVLAEDWSPEFAAAWRDLLGELEAEIMGQPAPTGDAPRA
jgi:hemoglobin-like flavoprotein